MTDKERITALEREIAFMKSNHENQQGHGLPRTGTDWNHQDTLERWPSTSADLP